MSARRLFAALSVLAVLLGVLERVVQWAAARSFWLDEVALALNLQTHSYRALTGPLVGDQAAPVGWLWVERWVFVHVGPGELALRLLPLAFGCGAVVVVAVLAWRLLSPGAATVACVLAAASPALVYYSDDLKQYSSDTFWVPLLALLTVRCLDRRRLWVWAPVWGVLAAVGFAFSHALLLAVAGYGVVLLAVTLARRSWRDLGPLAVAGATVLLAALGEYLVQLRSLSGDPVLLGFWSKVGGFPPSPSRIGSSVRWLGDRAVTLPSNPFGFHPGWVGLGLVVVGAGVLCARRSLGLLVLAAPLPVALAAALAHRYPLADRIALFLVPLGLIVVAAAVEIPKNRRFAVPLVAVTAALVAVGAPQVSLAAQRLVRPIQVSETREAFEYVAQHRQPDDGMFVYYPAGTSALYYAPKVGVPWSGTLYLSGHAGQPCQMYPAASQFQKHPRVWIVFGVRLSSAPRDERQIVLAQVGRLGHLVDQHVGTQAAAYLFAVGPPVDNPPPGSSLVHRDGLDCLVDRQPPPYPAAPH